MKKFLVVLLLLFLALGGVLLALPLLFGDQIKAKIQQLASDQVTAEVSFADMELSLFRDFPNLSVALSDVKIVGEGDFAQDTLLQSSELAVSLNLMSLLGSEMQIYGASLRNADVRVTVLEDGRANYNIYNSADEMPDDPLAEDEKPLNINIDHWKVTNTDILYLDYSLGMVAQINGLNHTGSGQIRSSEYDLQTQTQIAGLSVHYDKTDYFRDLPLTADLTIHIDNNTATYTFRDNRIQARDLPLTFAGQVRMPGEDIDLDLSFEAAENSFKNLLSLVPATYLKDYEGLQTEGEFTLKGSVKGRYTEERLPGFRILLEAFDARVQYPELPTAVSQINLDMEVRNDSGLLEETLVDIRNFTLQMGKHPVSGHLRIKGLERYQLNGKIDARLDLADVPNFYPLEDISDIRGDFRMNLDLSGVYDEASNQLPTFTADMKLTDGYLQTKDYPNLPLQNLTMRAKAVNASGKQADTKVSFDPLAFELDGKPFRLAGHVSNFDAPTYDLSAKGSVDLEKMLQLFPQEGMSVKGTLKADLETQGSMAAIEAENYTALPTSGTMQLRNFSYESTDYPQGVKITDLRARFTPQALQLEKFVGFLGQSDVSIRGQLTNYLAYGLAAAGLKKDGATLKGNMTLLSKKFNANEWLTEEETEATGAADTTATQLPQDVHFRFDAKIDEVLYDDMTLKNAIGTIVVKDGVLNLSNLRFNSLGGGFIANGLYDPRDPKAPKFDFGLNIVNADIQETFQTFSPVQTFMPLAKALFGAFSTELKLEGALTPGLMPRPETLTGLGSVLVKEAAFGTKKPEIVDQLSSFTGLGSKLEGTSFQDVKMKTHFRDGTMRLDPVDFRLGGYPAKLSGNTRADGQLDLNLDWQLPKQAVAGKLQSWFGVGADALKAETLDLHLQVRGTTTSPKVGLDKAATKAQLQSLLKATAKDKAQNFLESLLGDEESEEEMTPTDSIATDSAATPPDSLRQQKPDSVKKEKESPVKEAKDKAEDLKNTLKKWGFGKKKGG